MENLFYAGDNLHGLRMLADMDITVDLVYIDPPFATNHEFLIDDHRANTISASGRPAYSDTVQGSDYLDALRLRLLAIRSVMSPFGSIYVHIDVKMEHHVRLLMDAVFGPENFRNSIARIKCNPKNFMRYGYGNFRDTILFYSMSPDQITWNPQKEPLTFDEIAEFYPYTDATGRRYTTTPLHAPGVTENGPTGQPWRNIPPPPGRHWRYTPDKLEELDADGKIEWSTQRNPRLIRYAHESEGKLPQDVWEYKDPQRPNYPTQKNVKMLERIIRTSSNRGDTVLDCYAGSGSTLLTAARNKRPFVGMDNSVAAHTVIKRRLGDRQIAWREITDSEEITMAKSHDHPKLDFDDIERKLNLANRSEMANEINQRSERLQTRIRHFAERFEIPEEDFWRDLASNPTGPLAATLAREARRQNVHSIAAANYVRALPSVQYFEKLPSSGPNAHYINSDGQIVTGKQLEGGRRPSKSLDFRWRTGDSTCYAAQRFTREGGGNQDNQFEEIQSLLRNFQHRTNEGVTLFVLVDGQYYDDTRLSQMRALARLQSPRSYVTGVNDLQGVLVDMDRHLDDESDLHLPLFDTPHTE